MNDIIDTHVNILNLSFDEQKSGLNGCVPTNLMDQ